MDITNPFSWKQWFDSFIEKCESHGHKIPERDLRMLQHAFMAAWQSSQTAMVMLKQFTPGQQGVIFKTMEQDILNYRTSIDEEHAADDEIQDMLKEIDLEFPE